MTVEPLRKNMDFWQERVDLAAAFRWCVRLNYHEAVANHFSLAINEEGSQFLMNPNQMHFSRIKASDLLLIDANDPKTLEGPNAPDPTAWGLHGAVHRHCPHAKCAMHVHSIHATVLASLQDSRLLPIDQNSAMFFNRYVIDDHYGGLAFKEEGTRCASLLTDPKQKVLIMGNHGILVLCLIAAMALTVATLSVRGAVAGGNVMMIVGLQMIVGGVSLAIIALIWEPFQINPTWRLLGAFTYTTLIPGLAATFIWFKLVGRIGAVKAATFHFLNPFFGVLIAAALLGENIGLLDYVGVVIIALGILAVQLSKQHQTKSRPAR